MADDPTLPVAADADAGAPTPVGEVAETVVTGGRISRGQRPRRGALLAALAVVVIGGLGAAVVLVVGGDDGNPAGRLKAAQAAAGAATSFRFTASGEDKMAVGTDEAGSESTTRFTGSGEWTEKRWHITSDSGFGQSETVLDGTTSYDRWSDPGKKLDDQQWEKFEGEVPSAQDLADEMDDLTAEDQDMPELGDGFEDSMVVSMAPMVYLGTSDEPLMSVSGGPESGAAVAQSVGGGGFAGDPGGFLAAIGRMSHPKRVDGPSGVTTLAATLRPTGKLAEAFGRPIPDAQVELDVDADDLPTAFRFHVAAGDSSSNLEVKFSKWNEPVTITVPSGDQVDANPAVDEDGLRKLKDLALVWPTQVPDGWELSVSSPEETADMEVTESKCETVELDWYPVTDEDHYLTLLLRPAACALGEDPTPFQPGGPGGLASRPGTFGTVEVRVGQTAVDVDSDVQGAQLDAILRSLAPVDAETLIAAVPAEDGMTRTETSSASTGTSGS
jgi:hypothetical protein